MRLIVLETRYIASLKNMTNNNQKLKAALITNHGYAGVKIPVGGAPDTGGQNFYVNQLALALESTGFNVTIFTRGGFPFFESEEIRTGEEKLSDHIKYVYIPGGGDKFIRKEDIAIALDEETLWLYEYVNHKSDKSNVKPWEYFKIVNTHYWDAAIMGMNLVEKWKNDIALDLLQNNLSDLSKDFISHLLGNGAHKYSLYREIDYHLGELKKLLLKHNLNEQIQAIRKIDFFKETQKADTHVWTPHSLGIIKERNFWNKDEQTVRKLKFRERDSHERSICLDTSYYCSTSPEITRGLTSYHKIDKSRVFDFPPCIDPKSFRPRKESELKDAYIYLAKKSGIQVENLKKSKIIFETSRMDKTKRKDILLCAFSKIADEVDNTYLFIGGGPESSPVFKELSKLKNSLKNLKNKAVLLGFIPNEVLNELFSCATLFVSASEMEGFGMSVSQAAAARVCVISSDLIPFSTQYAQGAASVVPAGNVDSFAKEMKVLLLDEKKREEKAEKLYKIASEMNWETTAKNFTIWIDEMRKET